MAVHNMNMSAVGKSMYLHRNTVQYHVEQIKRETGLDARVFRDLITLLERIEAEDEQ